MLVYDYNSPIGVLRITYDDALLGLNYVQKEMFHQKNSFCVEIIKELDLYFKKELKHFTIPIRLNCTEFQKKVYKACMEIPYGCVKTYKQIGEQIGCRGYQAIGMALHNNPILLVVPCHRVISMKGIGGFGLGIPCKKYLMNLEDIGSELYE